MHEALRLPARLDLLDRTDLCVGGGGLAGVCAALTAAQAGVETVLVEERGALGWEISHGLELFLTPGLPIPTSFQGLLDELSRRNAFRDGMIDPVAAECHFDELLQAAGVRVHFRVFAGSWDPAGGVVRLTTKSGPLGIGALRVVDATEDARLARTTRALQLDDDGGTGFPACAAQAGKPVPPSKIDLATQPGAIRAPSESPRQAYARSFLLCAVSPPDAPEPLVVEGLDEAVVRPTLWPHEAHVRIVCPVTRPEHAEAEVRFAIAHTIEVLRRTRPGFEKASLALSAHEGFPLHVPRVKKESLAERLFVAGPCQAGHPLKLEERAQAGEEAARAAVAEIRNGALACR